MEKEGSIYTLMVAKNKWGSDQELKYCAQVKSDP